MTISAGNDYIRNGINNSGEHESVKSFPTSVNGSQEEHGLRIPERPDAANGHLDLPNSKPVMTNGSDTHHNHTDATSWHHVSRDPSIANGFDTPLPYPPPIETSEAAEPIAIVGMGMRLPGGVNGENSFWDMLVNKRNGRSEVPKDRYNVEAYYSATGGPGTVKTKHGYFLDHLNLQHLDASFFSMNKTEVERLDPQQRLLLEVVWECMENAGQVDWRGKNIGCYVGVFGEDWLDMSAKDTQHLGMYRITGSGDFAISNRISYEYDLGGPR